MELRFSAGSPPLAVIAAAKVAAIPLVVKATLPFDSSPTLVLASGQILQGAYVILRYIGNISDLYGRDAYESSQVDQWLDYAPVFGSGSEFEGACSVVDQYLLQNTFLVGNSLSIADIAVWTGVAGAGLRWESLRKSKKYKNFVRWFDSISAEYDAVLSEFAATYIGKRSTTKAAVCKSKEPQASTFRSTVVGNGFHATETAANLEDDLPYAEVGKVKLRFAPEPSGYLHIGHAKSALLNQWFADRYKGQLIVRFDDTNPGKESVEFVDNLLKDIEALGIRYNAITYTSEYFPQLLDMAENLIREGKAYVDDTTKEEMKDQRRDREGIESKCRNNSVEDNLNLWKEMIAGSDKGLMCCVRGKLDMKALNGTLRDPVYYRCNLTPHHRIGSQYKLYPTYGFCCPFVDAVEGITHALRSSEYHDRNDQYHRIQTDMGFRKVPIYDFSRLNMDYTVLSKRKLRWFVQNGKVEGWDDPRFPTLQGIARRGLKMEALIQFIFEIGASKNQNHMEWDKLWAINKKMIDPVCPRYTSVIEERRVLLILTDGPKDPFVCILRKHKKFEGAGEKAVTYSNRLWIDYADAESISVNEEVTLKDWGNAIVKEIQKDENGIVTQLEGVLHLQGNFKTTKLKLTWLPDSTELVRLTLVDFDYLITKKKLEKIDGEEEDIAPHINPRTRIETSAVGESDMRNLKRGDIIQLERKGYYRCDAPFVRSSKPIVLFSIPDGKQQTVRK